MRKIFFFSGRSPILLVVDDEHGLCPTYLAAMEVLAKPWSGLIIATLEEGPLRFSELSARLPAIGDRMLAARLKELGAHGVVARDVQPGPPVRVSYTLTEVGRGFHQVADAVRGWGRMILTARERSMPVRAVRARRSG